MRPKDPLERMIARQEKYNKRMTPFDELRREKEMLYDRAQSLCEALYAEGGSRINLLDPVTEIKTTALIRPWLIYFSNEFSSKEVRLNIDETHFDDVARLWVNDGKPYKTPVGPIARWISIRSSQKNHMKFAGALDIVEKAGADPSLNFDVSDSFQAIIAARDLSPEAFISPASPEK